MAIWVPRWFRNLRDWGNVADGEFLKRDGNEVVGAAGGGGVTDHGALTGLGDDDHTQYHTDARGDARYWPLSTDLATQAELDAVAAAKANTSHAHAGEDITSGTVADARIASTIARDSEVSSAASAAQAAAEATAASALSGHVAASDPHTGYRLESAPIVSADIQDGTIAVGDLAFDPATQTELDAHVNDATDAHAGTAITNTPAGAVAATTVQAAINELDTEKAAASHVHSGADITSGTVVDARIDAAIARDSEVTAAVAAEASARDTAIGVETSARVAADAAHEADTTAVHGIADTSTLYRSGGTDVAVADGGTGSSTAANARTALGLAIGTDVASQAAVDAKVAKSLFDANTILKADSDDTPAALTMAASTILARLAAGSIVAATPAELRTLLALVIGTNVQAWDADLDSLATVGLTAAGLALLDDASATAQRATLGIPAVIGGVEWTTIVKASDESVSSSTTLQDDNELFFTPPAAGVYEVQLSLVHASPVGAATPDIKFALGEDATARGSWTVWHLGVSDSAAATLASFALSSVLLGGTAAANRIAYGAGGYIATGALFKLQWAQNTSDANPTIVRAGSTLSYRKRV